MKLTSAEANKLIKQLRDEIALIEAQEKNAYRFVAATIEDKAEVRPNYSFAETAAALDEREEKIRRIKHALNVFNATTKPDGVDMTIDELDAVVKPVVEESIHDSAIQIQKVAGNNDVVVKTRRKSAYRIPAARASSSMSTRTMTTMRSAAPSIR